MSREWTYDEVGAVVADYRQMIASELSGRQYNKAAHRRALQPKLRARSPQSIEFKHANISAILIELGLPYISGYKPRSNYQGLLREVVEEQIAQSPAFIELVEADVEFVPESPSFDDLLSDLTDSPKGKRPKSGTVEAAATSRETTRNGVNYLELEARNRRLGKAGEEFIVAFERARLTAEGKDRLAGRVEHVAQSRGDGVGFDVLSFEGNGAEKWIEVKTTKYGAETPFFVSSNEIEVSESATDRYHLYRVFDWRTKGRFYALRGAVRDSCVLTALSYIAQVA